MERYLPDAAAFLHKKRSQRQRWALNPKELAGVASVVWPTAAKLLGIAAKLDVWHMVSSTQQTLFKGFKAGIPASL